VLNPDARILVVAAHADDEAIGCGGLLVRHPGPKMVVICTLPGQVRKTEKLLTESLKLAAQTGDYGYKVLSFPDQGLQMFPQISLNTELERTISEFQPDVVLTHSANDSNTDHLVVNGAATVAARFIPTLLYFHIPSPGEVKNVSKQAFISIDWLGKIELLRCYDSEMRPFPHPRSYSGMEADARAKGAIAGLPYAEAFEVARLTL
jgi:LmbE family N-acetylglucosaminyl deacetylase